MLYVEKHTILDIYDDYLVARSKFMTYKWYATLSLGGGRVERGVHIWILEKWDLIWTFDDKLLAAWDVTWQHTFLVVSFKGKKKIKGSRWFGLEFKTFYFKFGFSSWYLVTFETTFCSNYIWYFCFRHVVFWRSIVVHVPEFTIYLPLSYNVSSSSKSMKTNNCYSISVLIPHGRFEIR